MAALRAAVFPLSAKNRRGGHFLPPPSSARVKVNVKLKRPQKDNNFECMPSLCKYDLYDNLLLFRK